MEYISLTSEYPDNNCVSNMQSHHGRNIIIRFLNYLHHSFYILFFIILLYSTLQNIFSAHFRVFYRLSRVEEFGHSVIQLHKVYAMF